MAVPSPPPASPGPVSSEPSASASAPAPARARARAKGPDHDVDTDCVTEGRASHLVHSVIFRRRLHRMSEDGCTARFGGVDRRQLEYRNDS